LSGGVAALLGIVMALRPDLVVGTYQNWFIAAAVAVFIWFLFAFFTTAQREDRRRCARLAARAFAWGNELYNLIRDYTRMQQDGASDDELESERRRIEDGWTRRFRTNLEPFLDELDEESLPYPREIRELICQLETPGLTNIAALVEGLGASMCALEANIKNVFGR
jgi:hypothetical protein